MTTLEISHGEDHERIFMSNRKKLLVFRNIDVSMVEISALSRLYAPRQLCRARCLCFVGAGTPVPLLRRLENEEGHGLNATPKGP